MVLLEEKSIQESFDALVFLEPPGSFLNLLQVSLLVSSLGKPWRPSGNRCRSALKELSWRRSPSRAVGVDREADILYIFEVAQGLSILLN